MRRLAFEEPLQTDNGQERFNGRVLTNREYSQVQDAWSNVDDPRPPIELQIENVAQ